MNGLSTQAYVEATYLLNKLRAQLSGQVIDAVAANSIAHRIDGLQSFLEYLNHVGLGGDV